MGNDVLVIKIKFGIRVFLVLVVVDSEPRAMLSAYFGSSPCVALVSLVIVVWLFVEGVDLRTELTETVWSRGFLWSSRCCGSTLVGRGF